MSTETLSQPITQNITATEASPPAPLRMERGVITKIPLYVIHAFSVSSTFLSRPIGVTSHTTPLSNRRGVGGEACPIGVTSHTTPLSNRRGAGGEASVNSVCRWPSVGSKRWWKSSVKSVWSVREKMSFVREKPPTPHTSRPIGGNLTYYPISAGDRLRRDQLWKGGKTTSFHSLHQFYQEIYPYFLRRKKRTNRKFIGTQMANIGIKANCLLSPNQRKSCRKVLCKT